MTPDYYCYIIKKRLPHPKSVVLTKGLAMSQKANEGFLTGAVAIGLIVTWINLVPLFGPVLVSLDIDYLSFSLIFTGSHVAGLIGGAFLLFMQSNNEFLRKFINGLPLSLAISSVLLIYSVSHSVIIILPFIFTLFGLLSGLLISHWMAWFSSNLTTGRRGSIFGKAIGITYILLSLSNLLIIHAAEGLYYALYLSVILIFAGSILVGKLPVTRKQSKPANIKYFFPPFELILFAIVAYSSIALTYNLVITWSLKQPVMSWILIIPYLFISFFLAPRSDKSGRHHFFILALLSCGLGFLFLAIFQELAFSQIIVSVLINSGLLFIHLFYWLSLVELQNPSSAPLPMAIGVSIELIIIAIVYTVVRYIPFNPGLSLVFIGAFGVVLILIGFALTAGLNESKYFKAIKLNNSNLDSSFSYLNDSLGKSSFYKTAYFVSQGEEIFKNSVLGKIQLTNKELQISYMMACGYKNREIMKELFITENTLKYHYKNIYSKLYVSCRSEAIDTLYRTMKPEN